MKLIEELYNCDLSANVLPASYYESLADVERLRKLRTEELIAGLDDAQKKLFESIEHRFAEQEKISERYAFLPGFRFAMRLAAESFTDSL